MFFADEKVIKEIFELSSEDRVALFKRNDSDSYEERMKTFFLFCQYYFIDEITHPFSLMHEKMFVGLEKLRQGKVSNVVFLGGKNTAKTSEVRMWLAWDVVNDFDDYLWLIGADTQAATTKLDALFNCLLNDKIIADCGNLIADAWVSTERTKKKRPRKSGQFVTKSNAFFESYHSSKSLSGKISPTTNRRLSFAIFDDFFTQEIMESETKSEKIMRRIREVSTCFESKIRVLYILNPLCPPDDNIVMKSILEAPDTLVIRLKFSDWKERVVQTKAEADEINKHIKDKRLHMVSVEETINSITAPTQEMREAEYYRLFEGDFSYQVANFFTIKEIGIDPIQQIGDWSIYSKDVEEPVMVGIDPAGDGSDFFAATVLGIESGIIHAVFATQDVGILTNSEKVLDFIVDNYDERYLAIEKNGVGAGVVDFFAKSELYTEVLADVEKIKSLNQEKVATSKRYGLTMNIGRKELAIADLQTRFAEDTITVNDKPTIIELKKYDTHRTMTRSEEAGHLDRFSSLLMCMVGLRNMNRNETVAIF